MTMDRLAGPDRFGSTATNPSEPEPRKAQGAIDLAYLLRLARSRWWLVVLVLVPTVLATFARVSAQPPVYESVSTFVVRPTETNAEQLVRAMDTLLRGVEINTTYANVVGSRQVRERALERLDLSAAELEGLDADGTVVAGTSIVEIRTSAHDPEVAQAFGEAVAAETVRYIGRLDNAFGLAPLDDPTLPTSPVGPRVRVSVAVSALLGALLGFGLMIASGFAFPLGRVWRFDITDRLTGAHTGPYLLHRFRQELARIERGAGTFAVAIVVPMRPRRGLSGWLSWLFVDTELTRAATLLRNLIREEDVLAYLGNRRFAVLAPDCTDLELLSALRWGPAERLQATAATWVAGERSMTPPMRSVETLVRCVLRKSGESSGQHLGGLPSDTVTDGATGSPVGSR